MPDLNNPFFDATDLWGILLLLIVFALGWMTWKAAKAGAKDGKPAQLGGYVACAIIVVFMLWVATNVLSIRDGESFDQIGRMAKLKRDQATTTTR